MFIYGIAPLPSDSTCPLVTNNLKFVAETNALPNQSNNPTAARVDHRFSAKDNVFVKLNGGTLHTNFQGTGGNAGAPTLGMEANQTYLLMDAISGALSWTHVFSPSFFMETNGNRTAQSSKTVNGPLQQDWSKFLKLPNPEGDLVCRLLLEKKKECIQDIRDKCSGVMIIARQSRAVIRCAAESQ